MVIVLDKADRIRAVLLYNNEKCWRSKGKTRNYITSKSNDKQFGIDQKSG